MTIDDDNTTPSKENEMATDEHYFYECGACGADYTEQPPYCFNCGDKFPFWRGPFKREVERERVTTALTYVRYQAIKLADGRWELRYLLDPNVIEPPYAIRGYAATDAEAAEWMKQWIPEAHLPPPEAADLSDLAPWDEQVQAVGAIPLNEYRRLHCK